MPSGPKKRKAAAKKKKELEAINSSSCTTNGNASQVLGRHDLKAQDESKCDGSEVGSSLSQQHKTLQCPFTEEKGVCLEESQNVKLEDDGICQTEVKINVRQADKSNEVGVEQVEFQKLTNESDDESSSAQISENEKVVEEVSMPMLPSSEVLEGVEVKTTELQTVFECILKDIEAKLNPTYDMLTEEAKTFIKSREVSYEMLHKSSDARAVSETSLTLRRESSKIYPFSDKKVDSTANQREGKSLVSSVIHRPETTECIEKQPLVGSAPRLAEKTSWLSCCGLFDIFVGSGK